MEFVTCFTSALPKTPKIATACAIFIPDKNDELVYSILSSMNVPNEEWIRAITCAHNAHSRRGMMYIVQIDNNWEIGWEQGASASDGRYMFALITGDE